MSTKIEYRDPPPPAFTADGVPDDEILLAELIATAELQKIKAVRGTRGTLLDDDDPDCERIVPNRRRDGTARCCAIGTLEIARQERYSGKMETAVVQGNDRNFDLSGEVAHPAAYYALDSALAKWFQLGAAFIDQGRVRDDGSLDASV